MLSSEMASKFNSVNVQFQQIVREHAEITDKIRNHFGETIDSFREYGILDVEKDSERNNELYRLITRNQEIRGNLYMNGDIHLKGKIIKDSEDESEQDTMVDKQLDEAFMGSLMSGVQSKMAELEEQLSSMMSDYANVIERMNKLEENMAKQQKLSIQNQQLEENNNKNRSQGQGQSQIQLVYTPADLQNQDDNQDNKSVNLNFNESDIGKTFSITLHGFQSADMPELVFNKDKDLVIDCKKMRLELEKKDECVVLRVNKAANAKFCQINGFISENEIIITSSFLQ